MPSKPPPTNSHRFDHSSASPASSHRYAQTLDSSTLDDRSIAGEDDDLDGGSVSGYSRGRTVNRRKRSHSTASLGAQFLSTSYGGTEKRPTRSYLHSASHGPDEPLQFSSEGVRKQTQELASWALGDSPSQPPQLEALFDNDPERSHLDVGTSGDSLHPEVIEEESSQDETSTEGSSIPKSRLTELIRGEESAAQQEPLEQNDRASTRSEVVSRSGRRKDSGETAPLLPKRRVSEDASTDYGTNGHGQYVEGGEQLKRREKKYPTWGKVKGDVVDVLRTLTEPKRWNGRAMLQKGVMAPIKTLPAVFLGWLLNVLDALSYGMILFPLGHPFFEDTGPDGISMFFVSCIVSQLIYSCGASSFRGGVGSEMIEVVPFFHKMTYLILAHMGPDAERSAVVATVITSYALSSIVTGLIFFSLGALRLGSLVSFFPRSILTGCIGGVGIFLFITGIEVSARLDGNLSYNLETAQELFSAKTAPLWIVPLALAVLLRVLKKVRDHEALLPGFFIAIVVIFYIVVVATPSLNLDKVRNAGWVFEQPGSNVPFWRFYTYYKFNQVDVAALTRTIPSMFALSFFGILHVPINVPALAIAVGEDDVNVNRELIAHGLSNTISGVVGSIQNYLVYANSAIFIRNGGDSRLAGLLLAAATGATWIAGPGLVGYIPVMIVGALIYFLGIELMEEALWDSFGKTHMLEYIMIVAISLIMGFYDFVVGVVTGIVLACLIFVVQTSQVSAVRATYSGVVAESTVRRHPLQRRFLREVGSQVYLAKLAGYLFFGTIVAVENRVRELVDEERFLQKPIKYFIFDLQHVTGIDFSAADAFSRMHRILRRRNVEMLLSGLSPSGTVGRSLTMVKLLDEEHADPEYPPPRVFEDLNKALEACENELLLAFRARHEALSAAQQPTSPH
ncbi:hypothetical protein P152DRAFT_14463, partial [Eremomyces bilateralis CBS 781.70]